MNTFLVTFQGCLHLVVKQLHYITAFFKTPLDGYWQLFNLLWPEACRVMFVYGRYRYKKKCSENFIDYFSHSKNKMAKWVSTQKFF